MRCERCGFESEKQDDFASIYRSLRLQVSRQTLCKTCQTVVENQIHLRLVVGGFVVLLLIKTLLPRDPLLTFLVLLYPVQVLSVVVHEAAHALAALLVGYHVFLINIGTGPRLLSFRLGRTVIRLHAVPLSGYVSTTTNRMFAWRLRRLLVVAAGPASTVLIMLAGVFMLWRPNLPRASDWNSFFIALIVANIFPLAISMLPTGRRYRESGHETDGQQIFKLLFRKLPSERERLIGFYSGEISNLVARDRFAEAEAVARSALEGGLEDPRLWLQLNYVHIRQGEPEKAAQDLRPLLAKLEADDPLRPMVLNNLAWAELLVDDPAHVQCALDHSSEAYERAPLLSYIRGTRGAALVLSGEIEQGLALLNSAMQQIDDPYGKACVACFMAIGEIQRKDAAKARLLMVNARRWDCRCEVILLVERRMGSD
ncbi:MAG TPA: M50 family metallopeptidase [Tepidisphaeraceae bacterium]|jgi:hypothetical protein